LITSLLCAPALSQDNRRDQVAAASSRALDALRQSVLAEPIGSGYTVNDLIKRTATSKRLAQTLARAQQIGGPRWIDAQTCQVRLEIPAPKVAITLVEIARLSPLESPVKPEALQVNLRDWDRRTFSATGTSTGAAVVEQMCSDDASKKAVGDARQSAVGQVMTIIKPIPLADGKTVGDALAEPGVSDAIDKWLSSRPVTQVDFPDSQHVRVTLAAPADELFDTFRQAASKQTKVPLPKDEAEWGRVHDEFLSRVTPAATRGSARSSGSSETNVAHAAIVAPGAAAPDWVDRQMEAQGKGVARNSRLKAARAAEADAANTLRTKLDPLALSNGLTIAQAVRQNKSLENALDRALARAHTTKVDYQPDGSAIVTVVLELRDVWEEIDDASH
jgi:hypothetical protein